MTITTITYFEANSPRSGALVALVEEINALSSTAREAAEAAIWQPLWYDALDAALDPAHDAAHDDARAAMWDITWKAAWEAVLATAVRDVISPEHYATLMAPMEAARAVMLRERPQ